MDDILVLAPTRWKLRRAVNAVNVLRIRLPRPPRHARMVCCWMAEISCLGGEMAKVVCVLYDDPIEGYPGVLRPR
jgi:hypothetical protein